eukprot:gene1860-biopygen5808
MDRAEVLFYPAAGADVQQVVSHPRLRHYNRYVFVDVYPESPCRRSAACSRSGSSRCSACASRIATLHEILCYFLGASDGGAASKPWTWSRGKYIYHYSTDGECHRIAPQNIIPHCTYHPPCTAVEEFLMSGSLGRCRADVLVSGLPTDLEHLYPPRLVTLVLGEPQTGLAMKWTTVDSTVSAKGDGYDFVTETQLKPGGFQREGVKRMRFVRRKDTGSMLKHKRLGGLAKRKEAARRIAQKVL